MAGVFTLLFATGLFILQTVAVDERYYPRYHLAPPHGWMNDPNGFSHFLGDYHLFYQYNPDSSLEPGIAHWGHAKSTDLVTWEHLPIALSPDKPYDIGGVFSGSGIVDNGTLYLLYTGNVNKPGEKPDHVQHQALASGTDGVTFSKFDGNPVLLGNNLQPNIRDPKIWKHQDQYYMVLGNSYDSDTLGRALLFKSNDLVTWEKVSVLAAARRNSTEGFMWECPDFFELDGKFVLLYSPQGIQAQGDNYRNLYQTGYVVGDFDYRTGQFRPLTKFRELDHGHDFYATQTLLDPSGKRVMVAWMDMWEENYPEKVDGFTGQMTIPRVLSLSKSGKLLQTPIAEVADARAKLLFSGRARGGKAVFLPDKAAEVDLGAPIKDLTVLIESNGNVDVAIRYDIRRKKISLQRVGRDGLRMSKWTPRGKLRMKILIDASSIEVFCGDGEVTFSSRFFPSGNVTLRLGEESIVDDLRVQSLKRTVPLPDA